MTSAKTKRIEPGYEPIEGYVLEKRIGQGGYGEVWRAEAPGGLKKAVKFVFGQHDERRAEQELKSLERIKGVQHPFILTLERFELIENQLVIVTELAERSLEDIYKQQQARGSCGISRDVLLGYMRDAADALDYLHQLYKLQHLDIKPANLLIVGGRVKVADFGLLKDLGEVECSVVGGLTPIYAPPELFDGRPSMHSDQYSLAVMYQELLTSTRPFGGRTIAQLATQHVHNAPNLNPLPASDRPIVARALEKSPDRRYASCSEFVDKLVHPRGDQQGNRPVETEATKAVVHDIENLPQLRGVNDNEKQTQRTHTLVVALGGTGADCLNGLRGKVYEYGAASPMTLHSVLIDTNPMTTQTAEMIEGNEIIPRCRVLDARLRTPSDYRSSGTERLATISRRWIYNVPRNGQTGGMRPLGRLALVDHGRQVMQTLRAAVEELKQSAGTQGKLKVYVVGSLTGGTGSGMYIDVIHLLRHLLDEMQLESEPVLSFLTTNRFQGDPSRPLALHAMKSAIHELNHFLKPGNSYPGDSGAGWPSVPAARTPLHHAYVVAQSDRPGAPDPIQSVIEYLWADANVCGAWLDEGRQESPDESPHGCAIRTFCVAPIGDPADRQSGVLAPHCVKLLLLRWLGNPRLSKDSANDFSARMIRRCYLSDEMLKEQSGKWLGSEQGIRRDQLVDRLHRMSPEQWSDSTTIHAEIAQEITREFDTDQVIVVAGQIIGQIKRELLSRLHDGRLELSAAITALRSIGDHAKQSQRSLNQCGEDQLQQLHPSPIDAQSDLRMRSDRREMLGAQLTSVITCRAAASIAAMVQDQMEEMVEVYSDASARIAQSITSLGNHDSSAEKWAVLDESIRSQLPTLVHHLHADNVSSQLFPVIAAPEAISTTSLVSDLTASATALIRNLISTTPATDAPQSLNGENDATTTFNINQQQAGKRETGGTSKTTCLDSPVESIQMTQTHTWSAPREAPWLTAETALDAVRPPLLECGGKQRLFLVCRDQLEQELLQSQFQCSTEIGITPVFVKSSVAMLIHEAEQIQLKNVLAWLDALTGDDGRISDRLATRCDVNWD